MPEIVEQDKTVNPFSFEVEDEDEDVVDKVIHEIAIPVQQDIVADLKKRVETLNSAIFVINTEKEDLLQAKKKLEEELAMRDLEDSERISSEVRECVTKLKGMVASAPTDAVLEEIYDGVKQVFMNFCKTGDAEMVSAIIDKFTESGLKKK